MNDPEAVEYWRNRKRSKDGTGRIGCCAWFLSELSSTLGCCCLGWCCPGGTDRIAAFGAEDPNGRFVDFGESFCCGLDKEGGRKSEIAVVKFVFWGWMTSVFVYGLWDFAANANDGSLSPFFLSYITYWAAFHSVAYMTLSLAATCAGAAERVTTNASFAVRGAWVMFLVSAVNQAVVTILYWYSVYEPGSGTIRYQNVMTHGGTFLLLLIEGFFVNRVPVRISHIWFVILSGLLYVGWSAFQGLYPINNPTRDPDESQNMYPFYNWEDDPVQAGIVSAVLVGGAVPILTMMFWVISLAMGRRYVKGEGTAYDDDDEEIA